MAVGGAPTAIGMTMTTIATATVTVTVTARHVNHGYPSPIVSVFEAQYS